MHCLLWPRRRKATNAPDPKLRETVIKTCAAEQRDVEERIITALQTVSPGTDFEQITPPLFLCCSGTSQT